MKRKKQKPKQKGQRKKKLNDFYYQGDIIIIMVGNQIGSEQKLIYRPCIVLQNNKGNTYGNTTIVSPLTKKHKKSNMPTHYVLTKDKYKFLKYDSMVLCEQLRTIDISRVKKKIGSISDFDIQKITEKVNKNF